MKRVLVIAAHPDDEVLGCGGTISKYLRRGCQFKVIFIAEGSSCRYIDPGCAESVSAVALRTAQCKRALELLGINDYSFSDFPCGRLDQLPIIEINKVIEQAIRSFDPDTVLTHSAQDVNNDHRIVNRATLMATRPGAQNRVARVLAYEILSSSEWAFGDSFVPNCFEDIDEKDLTVKIHSLAAYETEMRSYPWPRSEQGVRVQAMIRGMQAGVLLAEAYHIIREFRE
jgi:LmbE family N-acetylglucosaminyl deacetylase